MKGFAVGLRTSAYLSHLGSLVSLSFLSFYFYFFNNIYVPYFQPIPQGKLLSPRGNTSEI